MDQCEKTEEHLKKMIELFGELPDPVHQPKQFEHLVKMYKHAVNQNSAQQ